VLLHETNLANIFIPDNAIRKHCASRQEEKNRPFEKPLNLVFMKTKSFSPMGALHPILFFAGVYIVALLFSIFICSSLFYSCNVSPSSALNEKQQPVEKSSATSAMTVAVMR
jgi:hypothetical protein